MRVFRMQHPERIDVVQGSPKYESLNPKKNLSLFTVKSSEICILTLRLEEGIPDPVELRYPVSYMKSWVMRDTSLKVKMRKKKRRQESWARGRLLLRQYCSESSSKHRDSSNGRFKISEVLPSQGRLVTAKDLAHLAAHLAIVHAGFATDGPLPEKYEEATFYSEHNSREIVVAYNWPMRVDQLDAFFGTALDYIDSCVAGRPDKDFLRHMQHQKHLHEQRRRWEEDVV